MEKIKTSVKNGIFISLAITACLNSAYAVDSDSLATGNDSDATKNSVTVGNSSTSDDNSVTTGNNSTSKSDSVTTGNDSNSTNGSVSTGNGAQSTDNSVAQGNNSNASQTSVAVGNSATASGQSVSVGNNSTSATNSVTVGNNSSSDTDSIAIGNQSTASMRSFAAGGNSTATDNSFAFGYQASGTRGSVAFGNYSTSNDVSISMGYKASSNYSSMAFGYQGYAYYQSFSFGNNSTASYSSITFGFKSSAYDNSLSLGNNAKSSYSSLAIGNNSSAIPSNTFALGMNAVASAKYGMALGYGATSNKENSIAIGYNSTTTIGAEPEYLAYGLNAPQASNGEFSVGSSTIKRKITNVAAGSYDNDAVNVAQLKSVNDNLTSNIDTLSNQAVQYDVNGNGVDKTHITLNAGGAPTTIANVADAKNNNEAVNLKQLNTVNNNLSNNINTINDKSVQYEVTDGGVDKTRVTLNPGGDAATISNVADAKNDNEAVNLKQLNNVNTSLSTSIATLSDQAVQYAMSGGMIDKSRIILNNGGSAVTISNVADAQNDNEAVNLKQLKNVSSNVAKVNDQAVQYDTTNGTINKNKITLNAGGSATTIANVADAKNNDEAVNLKQLNNVNDTLSDSITALSSTVIQYDTDQNGVVNKNRIIFNKNGTATRLSNVADATENTDAVNLGQLNNVNDTLTEKITTLSTTTIQYDTNTDGSVNKNLITFNKGGTPTRLTNIAKGTADNDAVNVLQLNNVSDTLTDKITTLSTTTIQYDTNTDGSVNKNVITFNKNGTPTRLSNIADGINDDDAVNLRQLKQYGIVDPSGNNSTAVTYNTDYTGINLDKGKGSVVLSGVAEGKISANSTDAVNGSQFYSLAQALADTNKQVNNNNAQITTLSDQIANMGNNNGSNNGGNTNTGGNTGTVVTNDNAVEYNSTNRNKITLKGEGGTVVSNVADGVDDNDAVNVKQLKNTNNKIADIENGKSGMVQVNNTSNAAAAKATGKNSVAVGHGAVSSGENSVSIGANSNDNGVANTLSVGSIGAERTISNVAAGINTNDAVNVGQLNTALNQNLIDSQAYTDAMGSRLSREIKEVDRDSKAGIAAAMAMATMPQSNVPGRGMVSVGLGSYESQSALSVGASVVSPKGKWVYKVNGSVDSRNHFGAALGAGYQW